MPAPRRHAASASGGGADDPRVARLGRVLVVGQGRLGRAIASALRRKGASVRSVGWRRGRLPTGVDADLVLLATRDQDLEAAAGRVVTFATARVVLHCAGSLGPEVLAAARRAGHSVGQLHPLLSVASGRKPPPFDGAWAHVSGDRAACSAARRLARVLGLRPFTAPGLNLPLYHASAVLVAGGAACLLEAASRLLQLAGAPPSRGTALLTPLLRSVAHNLDELGLPQALTGPARRADREAIERQLGLVRSVAPEIAPLALELARCQLVLAAAADPEHGAELRTLARQLAPPRRPPTSG